METSTLVRQPAISPLCTGLRRHPSGGGWIKTCTQQGNEFNGSKWRKENHVQTIEASLLRERIAELEAQRDTAIAALHQAVVMMHGVAIKASIAGETNRASLAENQAAVLEAALLAMGAQ